MKELNASCLSSCPTYSCDLADSWMECCALILTGELGLSETEQLDDEDYDDGSDDSDDDEMLPIIDFTHPDQYSNNNDKNSSTLNVSNNQQQRRPKDRWTQNALLVSNAIQDMCEYLHRESHAYVGSFLIPDTNKDENVSKDANSISIMTEAEKSILESTVTSFTISTANQIEQLRQTAHLIFASNSNRFESNITLHREGIVAILLHRLQTQVMAQMSSLHQLRARNTISYILQDPLACGKGYLLWQNQSVSIADADNNYKDNYNNSVDESKNNQLETDQDDTYIDPNDDDMSMSFMYLNMKQEEDCIDDFLASSKGALPFSTKQMKVIENNEINASKSNDENNIPKFPKLQSNQNILPHTKLQPPKRNGNEYDPSQYMNQTNDDEYMQNLHRENTLLTSQIQQSTQNLNEVHKLEQSMMQITTLLNQFANLISEQQEEVLFIHESAMDTKDKMEKGTNQIVDATERSKQSGHYMAKAIFGMAVVLLLLNSIM